jgi:hypothetical protein
VDPVSNVKSYSSSQLSVKHPLAIPALSPRIKLLSCAGDLENFFSSPQEWPALQKIMETYGITFNAKANFSKAVFVSLSGNAQLA